MNRGELVVIHVANALVVATGVVYAAMKYLMRPSDEWAVVNHPWQPHVQHLHVLVVPLLVFAVGLLWSRHVIRKLRNGGDGRSTGLGLVVAFVPMAASGYLLQVTIQPEWRTIWIAVHVVASVLWITAFGAHQLRSLAGRASKNAEVTAPVADELS